MSVGIIEMEKAGGNNGFGGKNECCFRHVKFKMLTVCACVWSFQWSGGSEFFLLGSGERQTSVNLFCSHSLN